MDLKLNFTKKDKTLKKDNYQLNADLYWRIILLVAFIFIVFSAVFGFILFNKTSKALNIEGEYIKDNTLFVTKERIEKALNRFAERKSKSIQIISYPSGVVDPSL